MFLCLFQSSHYVPLHINNKQFFFRQGHAAAVVDKKTYIFGGSSGSGFGGQHDESTSDPVYLNDLFVLKGISILVNKLLIKAFIYSYNTRQYFI